jgi:tight adherence protein B
LLRGLAALVVAGGLTSAAAVGAWAVGEGNIDHTETKAYALRILYSIPELPEGTEPDLASLEVTVNDTPLKASAKLAASADASEQVRRTAILAIDTSNSMRGDRFEQAKAAAKAFLESAPRDVQVGIVAFAGSVEVVQPPSLDRDAAGAVIDDLSLSLQTRLYDGVIAATQAAGSEGQRSLLVLSDGRDTSDTELKEVVDAIAASEVRVDVVALGEAAEANAPLESMASEGDGTVVAAQDPEALTTLFSDEAAALARQVLISAPLPGDWDTREGSVTVSIDAGGETYSDTAFVSFGRAAQRTDLETGPLPTDSPSALMRPEALWAGLGAIGLGVLVVLLGALGVLGKRDKESLEDTIAAYTRAGAPQGSGSRMASGHSAPPGSPKSMKESAVGVAQKALEGNGAFESKLAGKLEAADVALKPAEWLLIHSGIAIGAALFGFLLSSGGALAMLLLLFAGGVLPWLYLSIRKSRRLKAFNAQLAETLQLIAGSLSAGLSLAQSLDTVVREGNDPIATEFRRALVEARLGVAVEDSLEGIAKRMESADFEWVVMAIRIQREVGGNLAELLLKVAGTMRERDYLRRQVKALSAEGKMSAYILGALPVGMFGYMLMVNRTYVTPLFTTPLGWLMLISAMVLMAVGAFWMSRVVKVEV